MKKGGLGSIPKSLSWIEDLGTEAESVQPVQEQEPVTTKVTSETKEPITVLKKQSPTWFKATFIVDQDIHEKVKALAYWDRVTVKEVVHEALTKHLQGRSIKPMPKKSSV